MYSVISYTPFSASTTVALLSTSSGMSSTVSSLANGIISSVLVVAVYDHPSPNRVSVSVFR